MYSFEGISLATEEAHQQGSSESWPTMIKKALGPIIEGATKYFSGFTSRAATLTYFFFSTYGAIYGNIMGKKEKRLILKQRLKAICAMPHRVC